METFATSQFAAKTGTLGGGKQNKQKEEFVFLGEKEKDALPWQRWLYCAMRLSRLFCRFVRNFVHSGYLVLLETHAFHLFFGSSGLDLTSPGSSVSCVSIFAVRLFSLAATLRKLLCHVVVV